METVNKVKRTLLTACLFVLSAHVNAQDFKTLQQAFAGSYTHENSGAYAKAIDDLKKIYSEDSYEVNLRLGWLCYKGSLYNESVDYYQKAVNLKPYAFEPKLGLVLPLGSLGSWEQVKSIYLEILKTDPHNTLVNYRMGSMMYVREDYASALKYLEKVVNLYPFDYDSVVLYAWTFFRLGKLREAKVLFNKALMIRPNDASALEGLGLIK